MTLSVLARLKKWGNSLGLIVPAETVRERGLHEGDLVDVDLGKRTRTLEELSGTIRLGTDLDTLMREVKAGWDDL